MQRNFILIYLLFYFYADSVQNETVCTCFGTQTVEQAFKNSSVIFTGEVSKIETVKFFDTIYLNNRSDSIKVIPVRKMMKITFAFEEIFKSKFVNKIVNEVYTNIGVGSCGYNFYSGKTFLVYSDYSERIDTSFQAVGRILSTSICTRTKIRNESVNEEILELRKLGAKSN